MKVTIIGTGYVGLVTGACFAEMGNTVLCADVAREKIERLKNGKIPIYEPGLEDIVVRNYKNGNLKFTDDIAQAVKFAPVCFIAVGTPMGEDGAADMRYVDSVVEQIAANICQDMIVVDKSTVPVGTAKRLQAFFNDKIKKYTVKVVSVPEFLKEGTAVEDCMHPDRVVIGTSDNDVAELLIELYSPFVRNSDRFIIMDATSAEMTKYAANAMLATRISFMNELSAVCEATGADIMKVRLGIGSDKRIGYSFLYAGCGYGGSCFPKDVQALIHAAKQNGCDLSILRDVEEVNKKQKLVLLKKITAKFGDKLNGKKFALWGIAFKPGTNDIREAPSIVLAKELMGRGAAVTAYDPEVNEVPSLAKEQFKTVTSKYAALEGADALILVTEWKEFRSPDFDEIKKLLKQPVIFDGRNQYSRSLLQKHGLEYYGIGTQ
jgi:UDPglucose 6-dehydrogenase